MMKMTKFKKLWKGMLGKSMQSPDSLIASWRKSNIRKEQTLSNYILLKQ